jgi:uncharacterized protein
MKKTVVALFASLAFAHGAFAAESTPAPVAANVAAVRDLMDAMNYRSMWQASMEQMAKTIPSLIREQALQRINADAKLNDAGRKESLAKMDAEVPRAAAALQGVLTDPALMAEMETEMVSLYSRHFTADELKQMAAYYRTPVGQKNMRMMPQVLAESMAISQRITMPRMQKAIEQFKDNKGQ